MAQSARCQDRVFLHHSTRYAIHTQTAPHLNVCKAKPTHLAANTTTFASIAWPAYKHTLQHIDKAAVTGVEHSPKICAIVATTTKV